MFRVALNRSRSVWRRLRSERDAWTRLSPEPGAAAEGDETIDIARALRKLPRRQREVVVLHYYLGFTAEGIGEVLGVTDGTVKTGLHRARKALSLALGNSEVEEVSDLGS